MPDKLNGGQAATFAKDPSSIPADCFHNLYYRKGLERSRGMPNPKLEKLFVGFGVVSSLLVIKGEKYNLLMTQRWI